MLQHESEHRASQAHREEMGVEQMIHGRAVDRDGARTGPQAGNEMPTGPQCRTDDGSTKLAASLFRQSSVVDDFDESTVDEKPTHRWDREPGTPRLCQAPEPTVATTHNMPAGVACEKEYRRWLTDPTSHPDRSPNHHRRGADTVRAGRSTTNLRPSVRRLEGGAYTHSQNHRGPWPDWMQKAAVFSAS
ncbi:hypothetical protein CPLU01_09651 [Colletotrichum plurivorum]|uniref:Uncharacterized protein n=1 Tax=Colletotrichum plurivorum TaxID=2175906 RepID=A0A8H6K8I1_9PEZI|nr:hypothetical protein CPLU01_09651 [Colletotrichum plurivorum]